MDIIDSSWCPGKYVRTGGDMWRNPHFFSFIKFIKFVGLGLCWNSCLAINNIYS